MAANIQSSPFPLVFPLARFDIAPAKPSGPNRVIVRVLARALEGMQKEAVITTVPGGRPWRMVSDEGPYLNGTDLAPFPLAFFTVGLVNAYCAEIVGLAEARGIALRALELIQDNRYTMEGSAIRGDMKGGALPVELHVKIEADADAAALDKLIGAALARSPADALLRGAFNSEFAIEKNGMAVSVGHVRAWPQAGKTDLSDAVFDAAAPAAGRVADDIIVKLDSAQTMFNVEGGAGSSLQSEQKRTLHVRGICTLQPDGLTQTRVQLFKPIGSNFRFICDINASGEGARAPSPLGYLAAGVAFCFLTQVGRYAHIVKRRLERYTIAQDIEFGLPAADTKPAANPVRSYVALSADVDDETARRIVDMGEQTCFLHAACRTPLVTQVTVN
jgi:uncharacterized OsmC-like protein